MKTRKCCTKKPTKKTAWRKQKGMKIYRLNQCVHAGSKLQRLWRICKMAQNMAWNTGMKLPKRATKYHINPAANEK